MGVMVGLHGEIVAGGIYMIDCYVRAKMVEPIERLEDCWLDGYMEIMLKMMN